METPQNFRSQLSASSMEVLKEQSAEVARPTRVQKEKITYPKLSAGINRVRFFPAHPGGRSFIFSKHVHYVPQVVPVRDTEGKPVVDDQGQVVTEIKRLPIQSALVHSDVKGQDPFDLYIKTIKEMIRDEADGDDEVFKKKWAIVTHWQQGVTGKISWQAWANVKFNGKTEFGLLELTDATKKKIDKLVMTGDDAEGMIATDPFSDPDTGRVVEITSNPNSEALADRYSVAIDFMKVTPLTDEEIEKFMKYEPLEKMLRGTYYLDTFEKAVAGLKMFDDNHKFGVFDNEEFCEQLTAMSKLFKPRPTDAATPDAQTGDVTAPAADAPAQPAVKAASAKAGLPAATGRFKAK